MAVFKRMPRNLNGLSANFKRADAQGISSVELLPVPYLSSMWDRCFTVDCCRWRHLLCAGGNTCRIRKRREFQLFISIHARIDVADAGRRITFRSECLQLFVHSWHLGLVCVKVTGNAQEVRCNDTFLWRCCLASTRAIVRFECVSLKKYFYSRTYKIGLNDFSESRYRSECHSNEI